MRVLAKRWELLSWPHRFASVLAIACMLVFSLGGIVRAASGTVAADAIFIVAFYLLAALATVCLAFGHPRNAMRLARWIALAGIVTFVTSLVMFSITASRPIAVLALYLAYLLLLLAFLTRCAIISVWAVRFFTNAGTLAASTITLLFVIVLFVFSPVIVLLTSSGSTDDFALLAPASWSHLTLPTFLESLTIDVAVILLTVVPELAHRALPWEETSELTKSRVTRWLATGALASTGLLAFMFHFFKGPLDHIGPWTLVIGVLFAIALLSPIYRSVISSFWQYGVLHLIDFGRWRPDWREVIKDVSAGRHKLADELKARLSSDKVHRGSRSPASEKGELDTS